MIRPAPTTSGSWHHVLGSAEFPAEPDRYHLYVSLFCPFAHRVLLMRQLKGLQQFLPMSIVRPYPKDDGGWRFLKSDEEYPGSTVDHIFGSAFLHDVYFKWPLAYDKYEGKYSVPVLWDKKTDQIVNNESAEIILQLNTAFDHLLPEGSPQRAMNISPEDLREWIEITNNWLVPGLVEGVYRAGFSPDQESYDKACKKVFETLDRLEGLLTAHAGPLSSKIR